MLETVFLSSLSPLPQVGVGRRESRELEGEGVQDLELQGWSTWPKW